MFHPSQVFLNQKKRANDEADEADKRCTTMQMLPFEKCMVAVDGSPGSDAAFQKALSSCNQIHAVSVVADMDPDLYVTQPIIAYSNQVCFAV
jgi:hypothetical protein